MKKIFTLTILCLLFAGYGFTQIGVYNGKPRYKVESYREGVHLGDMVLVLYPTIAPKHVRNFDSLVSISFYDTTAFHRVIPGFVIQGGDPNSRHGPRNTWGYGQAGQQTVPAEFNPVSHLRGVLSAARSTDINSATSQFFICHASAASLNWNYTAYGKVENGINIVDSIVLSPRDVNDNPLKKIEMFITRLPDDNTTIQAPETSVPSDQERGVHATQKFEWSAVNGAEVYHLELSKDSTFNTLTYKEWTNTNSFTIKNLEQGSQTYYWRVKANNGGYISDASDVKSFITGLFPPALVEPQQASILPGVDVTTVWTRVEGTDSYRIQVSTNSLFPQSTLKFEQGGITDTSIVINGLDANRKYYWRVATELGTSVGDYSANRYFTTGVVNSVFNERVNLNIFPNPVQEYLYFSHPKGIYKIELYTTQGSLLKSFDKGAWNYENDSYSISLNGLGPSMYFIRVYSEDGVYGSRFLKVE